MNAKYLLRLAGIFLLGLAINLPFSTKATTISPDLLKDLPSGWKGPISDFDDALRNQFTLPAEMDDFFEAARDYAKEAEGTGKDPGSFVEFLSDYVNKHPSFREELSSAATNIVGKDIGTDNVAKLNELVIRLASEGTLDDMDLKKVDDLKALVEKLRDELKEEEEDGDKKKEDLAKKLDKRLENALEKMDRLNEKEKEAYEKMMDDMNKMQEEAANQLAQTQVPPGMQSLMQQQEPEPKEDDKEGGSMMEKLMQMLMMMMMAKKQQGGGQGGKQGGGGC